MKIFVLKKSLIPLCIGGILMFSSCVDETINLDNLSTDVTLARSLAIPLGEANFTVKNLLYHYDPSLGTDIRIDSTGTNGVVTLLYDKFIDYGIPTDIKDLLGFGTYETEDLYLNGINDLLFENFNPITPADEAILNQIKTTGVSFTSGVNFSCEINPVYNFQVNDKKDEQVINRIVFRNSSIVITVKSNVNIPDGMMKADFEMPITHLDGNPVIVKNLPIKLNEPTVVGPKDFIVLLNEGNTTDNPIKEKVIPIKMTFTGQNGGPTISQTTYLNFKIDFHDAGSQFVAYGKFYKREAVDYDDDKKVVPIHLRDYLPEGTAIYPLSPEVELAVKNNVGVPVAINIKSLRAEQLDPAKKIEALFENNLPGTTRIVNRPSNHGSEANTSIIFNNQPGKGEIQNFFGSPENRMNIDQLFLDLDFGIGQETDNTAEQFIASDSKVSINVKAKIPVHFKGSITYTDTIDNIDLEDALQVANSAKLDLRVFNSLPLGVMLKVELLDENKNPIIVPNALYEHDIESANVNNDGSVQDNFVPKEKLLTLRYNAQTIDYLKKAKHLKLTFTTKGRTSDSEIKLRMRDSLKVKASVAVIGGVSF